jgi:VanZ family protein
VLDWGPVLAWAGLIFWFSAQPNLRVAPDEGLDFVLRKAAHMFVFGVLAVLLWRALADERIPWTAVAAWTLAALYAVGDELHQSFTAGRHPSPIDVGIDCAGALLGLAIATALVRYSARYASPVSRASSSVITGIARMLKPPST